MRRERRETFLGVKNSSDELENTIMEDEIDNLNFAEDEENEEENYDPTNQEANKPKKKKKFVKILSENEKEKIKKTVEEMKINQIQPQITGGRVFKGPGFVSNPPKIVYKDFEIVE